MKHYYLLAIVACLFCALNRVEARIGETLEQCVARYGRITDGISDPQHKAFRKNGIDIVVSFDAHGKVNTIIFSAKDDFNAAQLEALMEANCGKQEWIAAQNDSPQVKEAKMTRDGAYYTCLNYDGMFMIFTGASVDEAKRKAAQKVDGF